MSITELTSRSVEQRVDALARDDLEEQLDAPGFAVRKPLHEELLERCRAAGQARPTPLILRYGAGDWNALHQDLYGDVSFPFQVLPVLSGPGVDHEGGEFVLLEQRPQEGKRGHYRMGLRHGVSTVTSGSRTALGIIFHDAR